MRYLEDTGTVVSVTGEKATVRLDHKRTEACGSCCACSALAGGDRAVTVDRGDLQEGDRVHVRIPQVDAWVSILLVFGLPLALFMAGIWVGQRLEGGRQVGNLSVLGGIVGLLVAFVAAWLANRALIRKAGPPRAERVGGRT